MADSVGALRNPSGAIQIFDNLKTNPAIIEARRLVFLFGTFITVSIFIVLWVNFLYNPWPWSWNAVNWLIFLRSGGPLLFGNHVSSEVAILSVTTFFAINNPKSAAQWIIVVLSTGSTHELTGIVETFLAVGVKGLANISQLYWLDLSSVLVLALIVGSWAQRKMIGEVALICAAFNGAWIAMILVFNIPTATVNGFAPGPAFFDWRENSLEVASWIVPSAWWVIRWRPRQ